MNIADHAISAGQAPAIDHVRGGAAISYGELYARSQRVAAVLHDAGLRRGDGVALVLPNRPRVPRNHLGLPAFRALLHRRQHPLHARRSRLRHRRLRREGGVRRRVDGANSRRTSACQHWRQRPSGRRRDLPGWRRYEDALAAAGEAPPMSDGSEMLYSSGTTGRPKAVRRPLPSDGNGSWAQAVLEMALTHKYGMNQSSVYLSPAPLYHAAGVNYTMAVNRVGAASIIMGSSTPRPYYG